MKTLAKITLAVAIFLGTYTTNAIAADNSSDEHTVTISIPEVALLDLEGTTDIKLSPTLPTEAGDAFSFQSSTNNNIWVNYSSIVAKGKTRNVTVKISSGKVPIGLTLKVSAADDAKKGKGEVGKPAGELTLTDKEQNLITQVKSCYTGSGATSGHNLTYSLNLTSTDSYKELVNDDTDITVTYTLTEN